MNAIQVLFLLSPLLAGVIFAGPLRHDPRRAMESRRVVSLCLATLILGLLLVGVVSHTFVRHIVQVIPPPAALILVARAFGFVAVARSGSRLSVGQRLASAVAFAVAQFLALVASFQPMFR